MFAWDKYFLLFLHTLIQKLLTIDRKLLTLRVCVCLNGEFHYICKEAEISLCSNEIDKCWREKTQPKLIITDVKADCQFILTKLISSPQFLSDSDYSLWKLASVKEPEQLDIV